MININKLIAKQCNFICTYAEIEDDYLIAKIKYGLQCIYGDGSKLLLILILFAVLKKYNFEVHDQDVFNNLKANNPEYLVSRPDLSESDD